MEDIWSYDGDSFASLFAALCSINANHRGARMEPLLIIGGGLFAIPLVLFVLRLTRPSVIQIWNAIPDSNGSTLHNRTDSASITTMNPTRMERHLLLDGTPLEFPPSWSPWALFLGCVFVSILISIATTSSGISDGAIAIFILLAVPLWLLGFSIPVLAWWSVASRRLRLPIRRVQAEGWLVAGMLSAFPAFLANSLLTPRLTPSSLELHPDGHGAHSSRRPHYRRNL